MSTLEVNTVKPISGSSTITLGESGDTIALASGASQTLAVNKPAFVTYMSGDQSMSDNVMTKMPFNTEILDSNSAYDTSNYRFTVPSGHAGYYLIWTRVHMVNSGTNGIYTECRIRVNGSDPAHLDGEQSHPQDNAMDLVRFTHVNQMVLNLSVGDYVETHASWNNNGSDGITAKAESGLFFGYKLIGL